MDWISCDLYVSAWCISECLESCTDIIWFFWPDFFILFDIIWVLVKWLARVETYYVDGSWGVYNYNVDLAVAYRGLYINWVAWLSLTYFVHIYSLFYFRIEYSLKYNSHLSYIIFKDKFKINLIDTIRWVKRAFDNEY